MSDDKLTLFIDPPYPREKLPEVGNAQKCDNSKCPSPRFDFGYGFAGGTLGPYEYCDVCGKIVSASEDSEA